MPKKKEEYLKGEFEVQAIYSNRETNKLESFSLKPSDEIATQELHKLLTGHFNRKPIKIRFETDN